MGINISEIILQQTKRKACTYRIGGRLSHLGKNNFLISLFLLMVTVCSRVEVVTLTTLRRNEQGKKEFSKSGVKMKLAGETPFEPDLNVWMELQQEIKDGETPSMERSPNT